MQLGDTPILIYPSLFIFGTFLCMAPTVFKPEFFPRNIKYWYLFSIILISTTVIFIVFTADPVLIRSYIGGSLILIFFIFECVIFIRFIKREESLVIEGEIEVRGIFTKPEKVTEEEVSISKEKKICLVCKGKVSRTVYICPECEAFYCSKCSEALSDLENACWVCEAPFDESKPVKPYKREEEKVIVEEKNINKKGKKKL